MHCKTYCAAMQKQCRFFVGFRKVSDEVAIISSCFLTHDCRTTLNIEHDISIGIKHNYRPRGNKLKYIVPNSTFLSAFQKKPDLTSNNNGTTAMQIRQSVEHEEFCIPISASQSFSFLSSKNEDNWLLHTKEFTLLPDLFLKMKVADPEGLYILNFLSVSYPIPGVATDNLKEEQMFDFSMIIPSACKHFYQHGMEIAVLDGRIYTLNTRVLY